MYSLGPGAAVGKKLQKLEVQGTKVGERGELGSRLGKEKGGATLSPLFNHQFFYPFPQLWSLVPGYCMFCWVVNKVHPDEHQLVTTQLLLLQYIDCNCYFIGTTTIIHTP